MATSRGTFGRASSRSARIISLAIVAVAVSVVAPALPTGPRSRGRPDERASRPPAAPPPIVLRLEPEAAPGIETVRNVLASLGIEGGEVTPVFPRQHASRLRGETEEQALADIERRLGTRRPARSSSPPAVPRGLGDVYRLRFAGPDDDVPAIASRLAAHPAVEYAKPDDVLEVFLVPDDPYYASSGTWGQPYDDLWGLKKIQCEGAWDVSTGAASVVVAIVDTGVDDSHPDLATKIWTNPGEVPANGLDDDGNGYVDDDRGWDFCTYDGKSRDNDPHDENGHGTHCAGTAAAATRNATGIAAVSWGSPVMAVQALDVAGRGYGSDLAEAVVYAADNGAAVINCSWGGSGFKAPAVLADAIAHALDLGVTVVAAAGNDDADALAYFPAHLKDVITVSASDPSDARAAFSNKGIKIDVAAPGVDVLSCLAAGSALEQVYPDRIVGACYLRLEGTSMAAPHVAGLAALIVSAHPEFGPEQVRQVLRISADDIGSPGWDEEAGYGRINASRALQVSSALGVRITSPLSKDYVRGSVTIVGTASGPGFRRYRVEYGEGPVPAAWSAISQSASEVNEGTLAVWDVTGLPDGEYVLRVVATDRQRTEFEDRVRVWKSASLRPGWPVDLEGSVYSSAALAPVDGPAGSETVLGTPAGSAEAAWGVYHAITGAGAEAAGLWPRTVAYPVANSPAVGDLDLDGRVEIVGTSLGFRQVSVWDREGNVRPGFPVDVSRGVYVAKWGAFLYDLAPVLADVDTEPDLEILIASTGVVHAIDGDGSEVAGWPVTLMTLPELRAIADSPAVAVGDLDLDGVPEIVAWAGCEESDWPYARHTFLHVLRADGTPMGTGAWPMEVPGIGWLSAPTLGDLDGDGDLEILVGGRDAKLYAWHHDGVPVTGWPAAADFEALTDPVLADLDRDGWLEVLLATSGHHVHVYDRDGTERLTVGATIGGTPHPVVGDVDGDGAQEIVVGRYDGEIDAWDLDGSRPADWWRKTRDFVCTAAALGDLSGDGTLSLVAGSRDGRVYAWDLPGASTPGALEWPMYRQSGHRTGRYVAPLPQCSVPAEEVVDLGILAAQGARLSWRAQSPGTLYDVAGGLLSELGRDGGALAANCRANDLPDIVWTDRRPDPPLSDGYYYLVRARNACGNGSYGSASGGAERLPAAACP